MNLFTIEQDLLKFEALERSPMPLGQERARSGLAILHSNDMKTHTNFIEYYCHTVIVIVNSAIITFFVQTTTMSILMCHTASMTNTFNDLTWLPMCVWLRSIVAMEVFHIFSKRQM